MLVSLYVLVEPSLVPTKIHSPAEFSIVKKNLCKRVLNEVLGWHNLQKHYFQKGISPPPPTLKNRKLRMKQN